MIESRKKSSSVAMRRPPDDRSLARALRRPWRPTSVYLHVELDRHAKRRPLLRGADLRLDRSLGLAFSKKREHRTVGVGAGRPRFLLAQSGNGAPRTPEGRARCGSGENRLRGPLRVRLRRVYRRPAPGGRGAALERARCECGREDRAGGRRTDRSARCGHRTVRRGRPDRRGHRDLLCPHEPHSRTGRAQSSRARAAGA